MKRLDNQRSEPCLLKSLPQTYFEATATLNEALDCKVIGPASSPYREQFRDAFKMIGKFMAMADLEHESYKNLKTKLQNEAIRKSISRRRIHKGGPINVATARAKLEARKSNEAKEAVR